MVSFNVSLFLLALPAFLVQAETKLRGNHPPESVVQRDLQTNSFNERLGQCTGAVCGLWGDPHMITCDGMGFDCQGLGAFNIMDNHMFKVQGRFVDVGAHEHALVQGWGLTEGASLTNDLAIQFKQKDTPVIQFGFGDLSRHDGTFPSEDGCNPYQYYLNINMNGQGRSVESSVRGCRERCENTEGCTKFHYWPDGGCHLNDEHQTVRYAPHNWPRVLSGYKEECGAPPTPQELEDEEEAWKSLKVVNSCPLLMHLDGELVDISQVGQYDYFYGDQNSEVKVQNINDRAILMSFTDDNGEKAEVHIWHRGRGPGELWSCHFDFWVCLPKSDEEQFIESSGGLLGIPDGDTQNDFLDKDGNTISLVYKENWHKTLIDYCYENHCVDQYDSILTPPKGQTFEDIKCEHKTYKPFDPEDPMCVLTADQMHAACDHHPAITLEACLLDCCEGGCDQIDEVIETIEDIKKLSEEEEDIKYDIILKEEPEEACVEEELQNTKDTVCPSAETEIVKLLSTSGTEPLPPDHIFYDMVMDAGDDEKGRTLKFKVANPFALDSHVYVRYGKSVFGHAFMDPKCDPFLSTPNGCNADAVELEVACHDYEGIDPFALVQVYFASGSIKGSADIDQCCLTGEEDLTNMGTVMYSFEIQCACPANQVAVQ